MNSISPKRIVKLAILIMLLLSFAFSLCACGNKLTGNWVCTEHISNYPGSMTLKSNGTGVADGYSISWYTRDNTLTMSLLMGTYTYDYELKGSTLYLDGYAYHKK